MLELNRLLGASLVKLSQKNSELYVEFSCGNLRVFNSFLLSADPENLVGRYVESIDLKNSELFLLTLSENARIEISLKPEDYIGPEAFCIKFNDGAIVVE